MTANIYGVCLLRNPSFSKQNPWLTEGKRGSTITTEKQAIEEK
jgi:hypothetical protein